MRNVIWGCLLGGLILVSSALLGHGAEPTLEDYAKAGQPGPEHKKLQPLVGSWTFTMKMWMDPSKKEPIEGSGVCERSWILGDRFIHETVTSDSFGQKFTGIGVTGYDNAQGKYTSGWIDSMSTGLATSLGSADKEFTFTGEHTDAVTKKKVKGRDVIKIDSNDKHVIEMFKEIEGKEVKVMEMTFTRKK